MLAQPAPRGGERAVMLAWRYIWDKPVSVLPDRCEHFLYFTALPDGR